MPTNIELLLKSIYSSSSSIEFKALTRDEEIHLGNVIQDPNTLKKDRQEAVNVFVLRNIYLVLKLVHKYKRNSFDFEDLVSYGILGLFSAAYKYNPLKTNRFASYARHWIKESIMKAVREYSGLPKIPVYLVKDLWNVTRVLSKNEGISNSVLSKKAELPVDTVKYLRTLLFKNIQFDQAYTKADNNTPEKEFIDKEKRDIFQEALNDLLTEDERVVLNYACELNGCKKMTFAIIESKFNIKNARGLKSSAVNKLRKRTQLKDLLKDN